jgi:2-dehydro-3-deoxygluconokinase
MQASDLPLDVIRSARYLHLTGITPALSESCAATASAALAFAKEHDTRVSFDVNYRALLWSANTAAVTLEPFCETADIVLVALRDASKLFGESGSMSSVASSLQVRWGGTVVVTDGSNGAAGCDGKSRDSTAAFETEVVDRLGAGDAFASGLLCRLLEGASLADALRFAAATAALKLSIPGDIALVNRSEVDALLEQGSGTLSR